MEIARYEKRVIAYLIDLVLALAAPCTFAIILYIQRPGDFNLPIYFYFLGIELAAYIIYNFLTFFFLVISRGFTFGSLIVGIKVIHPNRAPLRGREAFLRGVTIGVLPLVLVNAIYMLVIHTERTIFDRMTETVVVDYRHR